MSLIKLNCAFLNCIGKSKKKKKSNKKSKKGPTGTSHSLLPLPASSRSVGRLWVSTVRKRWLCPGAVCRVCVGRPASSDVLWDIGQDAKNAASLLFLWLQHPKVVLFGSHLPDVGFPASLVHIDETLALKRRLWQALHRLLITILVHGDSVNVT